MEFVGLLGTYALFAVYFGIFAGIPALIYKWSVRREAFTRAASRLSLILVQRGWGIAPRSLSGKINGFSVSVTERDTGRFRNGLHVVVDGATRAEGRVPAALRLAAVAEDSDGPRVAVPLPPEVDDPPFDAVVRLGSDDPAALASLDWDARHELRRMMHTHRGARVEGGKVMVDVPKGLGSGEELADLVTEAVALAQRLVFDTERVPARLAHIVRNDPVPGVRARMLAALAHAFPSDPRTEETLRAALGDPDEGVRLAAALGLDDRLPEALQELLARPGEEDDPAVAWAIAFLPGRFPAGRIRTVLRAAARHPGAIVRAAGLRALAASGDESCEAAALGALGNPEEPVVLAAVEALGAAGTVAAVPLLRALAEGGGTFEFGLRRAVGEAIAKIKSRLDGAAAGQVSLASSGGAGGGELSLAGDPADAGGRVSLPEAE